MGDKCLIWTPQIPQKPQCGVCGLCGQTPQIPQPPIGGVVLCGVTTRWTTVLSKIVAPEVVEWVRDHISGIDDLAGLFFEAAETERKMPRGAHPGGGGGAWPEIAPDASLAYGYGEYAPRPSPANGRDVTRWDVALALTRAMAIDDARLVWRVCFSAAGRERGPAWSAVGRSYGVSHRVVRRRFEGALISLYYFIVHQG